jgi:L-lysine exporter family protein LysE/ArgO
MTSAFLYGCGLGFSLLAAIGAQNVHVINYGLRRQYSLLVPMTCFLCDVLLVSLGVLGIGELLTTCAWLKVGATLGGIAFLLFYAYKSFASALSVRAPDLNTAPEIRSRRQSIYTTLAVSLLNPNVYLDTVVLVGGASVPLARQEKIPFLAGALSASFVWFFGMTGLARLLGPRILKAVAWKQIDGVMGGIMLAMAIVMTMLLFRD